MLAWWFSAQRTGREQEVDFWGVGHVLLLDDMLVPHVDSLGGISSC